MNWYVHFETNYLRLVGTMNDIIYLNSLIHVAVA